MPLDTRGTPEAPAEACCTLLRCKSMYYRQDERPGRLHDEDAMGYWCLKTNDQIGPDKQAARHCDCQNGRACYQEPKRI